MSLFRRALITIFGVACLTLGVAVAPVSADPPSHAQNDGNGNSDSPGPGNGQGSGRSQGTGGGQGGPAEGSGGSQRTGGSSTGGNSGSNPDGGGLDKPDCEGTPEGCQGSAPRDGNNGCGNEEEPKSERDDDNNGNCGGGQTKDSSDDPSVVAAAARAAWRSGSPAQVLAAAAGAAQEAARATEVDLETGRVEAAGEETASVMGAAAERAVEPLETVDVQNVELARSPSATSDERSLLAMTGMALLTLLAVSLFVIGVGRLFRGVEGEAAK